MIVITLLAGDIFLDALALGQAVVDVQNFGFPGGNAS